MNAADPEVKRFVQRLCQRERAIPDAERRAHGRYQTIIPVYATPCDEHGSPVDDEFRAVTKDFSVGGLCLLHTRPIDALLMLIRIHHAGESMTLKVRVMRCRAISVFYEIGVCFLERMTDDGANQFATPAGVSV